LVIEVGSRGNGRRSDVYWESSHDMRRLAFRSKEVLERLSYHCKDVMIKLNIVDRFVKLQIFEFIDFGFSKINFLWQVCQVSVGERMFDCRVLCFERIDTHHGNVNRKKQPFNRPVFPGDLLDMRERELRPVREHMD
jgi:hypothetical protein